MPYKIQFVFENKLNNVKRLQLNGGVLLFCSHWLGEKKWVAPILDHILRDQSLDHSLVLDQDQDHIQERRDTGESLCF